MLSRLIWQRKDIGIFFYQFWSEIERLRSPAFILLSWGFTPKTGIWKLPLSSNLKKEKGNEYWLFLNQLLSNFGVNNSPSSCVQLLDRNKADIFISWCDNFFGPKIQNNTKYFEKNSQAIQPIKTSTCLCFSRLSSRTYHWAKTNSNVHWIQTRNKNCF